MKNKYKYIISDVAMEISIDSKWRKKIFSLEKNEILEFGYKDENFLPEYIRDYVVNNRMTFGVQIVEECDEHYDEGLVIFKFFAFEYPEIVSYSGNNPEII